MKYMLLINLSRSNWEDMAAWSPEEVKTMGAYMDDLMAELTESGELVGGQGLGGPAVMKTVQARPDTDALVTDGPMIEAKELLAGYMELDVPNIERAVEIAERWSAGPGRGGIPANAPIEVHPVLEGPDLNKEMFEPYRKSGLGGASR